MAVGCAELQHLQLIPSLGLPGLRNIPAPMPLTSKSSHAHPLCYEKLFLLTSVNQAAFKNAGAAGTSSVTTTMLRKAAPVEIPARYPAKKVATLLCLVMTSLISIRQGKAPFGKIGKYNYRVVTRLGDTAGVNGKRQPFT